MGVMYSGINRVTVTIKCYINTMYIMQAVVNRAAARFENTMYKNKAFAKTILKIKFSAEDGLCLKEKSQLSARAR